MKKTIILLAVLFALCPAPGQTQTEEKADLVLTNAKIFTVSEKQPEAEALAVKNGKIILVGTNKEIQSTIGSTTKVLDAGRKRVIPGFIDAHCHFSSGGHSLTMIDLGDARTVESIQEKIAARIKELPEGAAVFGFASYPNPGLYGSLGWPTKEILDSVSPNNPVVIRRRGGHALWVNSVALAKSNITKNTETPEGGEIIKEPETGEPTGVLKEAASNLVKIYDTPNPEEDIGRALEHAAKLGLTGIHTGSWLGEIETYKKLKEDGKLTLRIYAWLPAEDLDDYIKKGIRQGQGDEWVKVGLQKIFIDGTIGVRTALMFEPFADDPESSGLAQMEKEEFEALVEKAHLNGYQVGVHAIGDKAVHWVLDAVELAQQKHGKKALRHRVEHNTVNLLADTKRFAQLGVIASMQPTITGSELYKRQRLGVERARRVDMVRTLVDNGTILAWGTDWPVSPINPIYNLYELVNRVYPEQRMTMAQAIKYYTWGPAYASFEEDIKGSLEVGKLADMIVLSQDLLNIQARDILKTEVLVTIVGGKIVYEKSPIQ